MFTESARILFVVPPGGVDPHFSEHLGAAYLRAVLARRGIASRQYLPDRNPSLQTFARTLEEWRPGVVGLSAYESNLRACRALVGVVREALPDAVVTVGGPNATFSPEETLDLLGADLCVRGAAEGTIAAIVGAIAGAVSPRRGLPDRLAGIRNLVARAEGGVWASPAGDLSSFPGAPFHHLDDLPSPYQAGLLTTADTGLLTARGCNQHCTYCSFAAISGRQVHYHGIDRVLDDLEALKALASTGRRRRRTVPFLDDAFSLAPERARAICEGIIRRDLQLPFECATRADRVDDDLLRLMRRAGFVRIGFGLESAVPRVLRAIGKVRSPDGDVAPGFEAEKEFLARFRRSVAAARAVGLAPTISIIGGLPGETAADLRETLAFVESLDVEEYTHNVLKVLPGTPIHGDRARHGLHSGRRPASWTWETEHAYDVASVPPLPIADRHGEIWAEARQVADALCGRPRDGDAGSEEAWAVVLHGGAPDPGLGRWLRQVLMVNGSVVVLDGGDPGTGASREDWAASLAGADLPLGLLALLSRETSPDGSIRWRSLGTLAPHLFEIDADLRAAGRSPSADEAGGWRVPIWIASDRAAPPAAITGSEVAVAGQQVADGCRWWGRGRRCSRPRVLHVSARRTVHPCWHGPVIGVVGDAYATLVARGSGLRGSGGDATDACPIGPVPQASQGAVRGVENHEVAALMAWLFQRETRVQGRQSNEMGDDHARWREGTSRSAGQ